MAKKRSIKRKLFFLYVLSFLSSVAPLIACLISNWDKYTKTPGATVKLCAGGIIAVVFLALKVLGKLRMPRRIVVFVIVFVLSYLLKALLDDLVLLSGMALLGELIDTLLFQNAIRATKDRITIDKTSDATSEKVEEIIKKYIGRV